MRGGSESFIIKDSAFYQSKLTAAVGGDTIIIYEELRSRVWRSRSKGNGRLRNEVKNGRLSANIRRQTVSVATGYSIKTVQRRLNFLRDIGWVRSVNGHQTGEALVYELGQLHGGVEVFYSDMDCREFYGALEKLAAREETTVGNIPDTLRVELGKEWITKENRNLHTVGSSRPYSKATQSPPQGQDGSPRPLSINNPSGSTIDKTKKYTGRCAPVYTSDDFSRPISVKGKTNDVLNEEQEVSTNTETETASSAIDPVEKARAVIQASTKKADEQIIKNSKTRAQRLLLAQRDKQLQRNQDRDQKKKNLKGGTRHTRETLQGARRLWAVYTDLIKDMNDTLPIPAWSANGNAKARGQVCNLVEMYGSSDTEQALQYMVRYWASLHTRFFKKSPPGVPNIGLLVSMHDVLFKEAALWGKHREVMEQWDDWYRENPRKRAPQELRAQYKVAKKELVALGL